MGRECRHQVQSQVATSVFWPVCLFRDTESMGPAFQSGQNLRSQMMLLLLQVKPEFLSVYFVGLEDLLQWNGAQRWGQISFARLWSKDVRRLAAPTTADAVNDSRRWEPQTAGFILVNGSVTGFAFSIAALLRDRDVATLQTGNQPAPPTLAPTRPSPVRQ